MVFTRELVLLTLVIIKHGRQMGSFCEYVFFGECHAVSLLETTDFWLSTAFV